MKRLCTPRPRSCLPWDTTQGGAGPAGFTPMAAAAPALTQLGLPPHAGPTLLPALAQHPLRALKRGLKQAACLSPGHLLDGALTCISEIVTVRYNKTVLRKESHN